MAFTFKNFFKQLWKDSSRTSCHHPHRWHEGLHHEFGFDVKKELEANIRELETADLKRFHEERQAAEQKLSDPSNLAHQNVEPPKSYHIKKVGSAKYRGFNVIHVGHLIPMGIRQGVNAIIDFIDYLRPAKNSLPLLAKGVMHALGLGFNILWGVSTLLKWTFGLVGWGCAIVGGPLRPLGKLFDGLSVAFEYCSKKCDKVASTFHSAGKYFNQFLSTKRTVMAHDKIIYPSTGPFFTFVKGAFNFLFGVFVQFPLYVLCSKILGDQTIDKAIDRCSGTKVEIEELAGTNFLAETLLKRKAKKEKAHKKQYSRCDIDAILKRSSALEMVPVTPRPIQPDEKDKVVAVVAVEVKQSEPDPKRFKRAQSAFVKSPRPEITVQTTRHKRTRTVGKKDSNVDSKSQSSSGHKIGSDSGEKKAGSNSGNVVQRIDLANVKQGSHSGIVSRQSNGGTPHSGKQKPSSDSGNAVGGRPQRTSVVVNRPAAAKGSPGSPTRAYTGLNGRPTPVKLFDGSSPPAPPGSVNQDSPDLPSGAELPTRQASA